MSSVVSNRTRDCTSCRLVSGLGLMGIGSYLAIQARRSTKRFGKVTILLISSGFFGLGTARFFKLPPFNHKERD